MEWMTKHLKDRYQRRVDTKNKNRDRKVSNSNKENYNLTWDMTRIDDMFDHQFKLLPFE